MDFARLVEGGEYDPKEIEGEYDRGVLRGYEMAMQDVETAVSDLLFDVEAEGTLRSKLEAEHASEVGDHVASWLESGRAEVIVSILDRQGEGE